MHLNTVFLVSQNINVYKSKEKDVILRYDRRVLTTFASSFCHNKVIEAVVLWGKKTCKHCRVLNTVLNTVYMYVFVRNQLNFCPSNYT